MLVINAQWIDPTTLYYYDSSPNENPFGPCWSLFSSLREAFAFQKQHLVANLLKLEDCSTNGPKTSQKRETFQQKNVQKNKAILSNIGRQTKALSF